EISLWSEGLTFWSVYANRKAVICHEMNNEPKGFGPQQSHFLIRAIEPLSRAGQSFMFLFHVIPHPLLHAPKPNLDNGRLTGTR
ncbi:hypothetical protein ACJX0J_034826, partial [Zea mays]